MFFDNMKPKLIYDINNDFFDPDHVKVKILKLIRIIS